MRLIVKGTKDEAVKAAAARGIALDVATETGDGHVLATCAESYVTAALLWFVEPGGVVRGEGYPAGVLLHYCHGERAP